MISFDSSYEKIVDQKFNIQVVWPISTSRCVSGSLYLSTTRGAVLGATLIMSIIWILILFELAAWGKCWIKNKKKLRSLFIMNLCRLFHVFFFPMNLIEWLTFLYLANLFEMTTQDIIFLSISENLE